MGDLILTTFDWVPDAPRGYVRDLRVRWALEEAGLTYRVQSVPFGDRNAEHFAHQPFGQVPWLTDGGRLEHVVRTRMFVTDIGGSTRSGARTARCSARSAWRPAWSRCGGSSTNRRWSRSRPTRSSANRLRRLPTPRSARPLRHLRPLLAQGRARLLRQLRDGSLASRSARRVLDVAGRRGPLLRRCDVSPLAGRQP